SESDVDSEHLDHDYNSQLSNRGNQVKRTFNKGRWTKDEDERLKQICDTYGVNDWSHIAKFFPDRSDIQCQHRWSKVLDPELVK
ncbi:hypothetical protein CAPTEDRAFT_49852, partial [Capitella teleta]